MGGVPINARLSSVLCFEAGAFVGGFRVGVTGGMLEQVETSVGVEEVRHDGGFEVVGGNPPARAGAGTFGLAGAAHVVEAVATMRAGTDVRARHAWQRRSPVSR